MHVTFKKDGNKAQPSLFKGKDVVHFSLGDIQVNKN